MSSSPNKNNRKQSSKSPLPKDKPKSDDGTGGPKRTSSSAAELRHSLKDSSMVRLKPEGGAHPYTSRVYDCCAYVIHCATHNRVLISQQATQEGGGGETGVWLPFTQLPPNRAWKESAVVGFCLILSGGTMDSPEAVARFTQLKSCPPYATFTTMQVLRLQMPQTQKFLTRLICYFKLAGGFKCCQKLAPHLVWHSLSEIESEVGGAIQQQALGPELMEYARKATAKKPTTITTTKATAQHDQQQTVVSEYSLEEALLYVPREPPRNIQEEMLMSLRITEKDVARLYADFLEHCLPSFYQTPISFAAYMRKHHLVEPGSENKSPTAASEAQSAASRDRLLRLFTAFNASNSDMLSFHEFLLGLVCIDPNTQHGEVRTRFVFRYYDTDKSGTLSETELEQMFSDMWPQLKGKPELKERVQFAIKKLGNASETTTTTTGHQQAKAEVSLASFIGAVGSHRLRGTSILCRSPKSIFNQISRMMAMRNLRYQSDQVGARESLTNVLIKRNYDGICPGCTEKKYALASHLIKIDFSGNIESELLPHVERVVPNNNTGTKPKSPPSEDSTETPNLKRKSKPPVDTRTSNQYSIECVFNPQSAANQIIDLVREFNPNKGNTLEPNGLLDDNLTLLYELLQSLSVDMLSLLEAEEKCQRVYSPCFVMGDIHGNLEDLLSLERSIWKQMPVEGANYLFLGDYVDRGKWGIECALYLFAFKVLCPNQVTLLRGNHEVRALQAQYSYKRELLSKYGESYGQRIWHLTNQIFDRLPVAAVLDDAIWCSHGGIPRSAEDIATLNQVARELTNPERQSKAAWEILWSDPCPMHQFESFAEAYDRTGEATRSGFLHNHRRGTAFLFNEKGATTFLARNGLTHIIRAHEVAPNGYAFNFSSNQCVTIFSTAHYCGNENESACILADNQRLRLIVPDTTNNASATDMPRD